MKMKVLIIEDHDPTLNGLIRLIRASWKLDDVQLEIAGVKTLAEGLAVRDANCTILDLDLPDSTQEQSLAAIKDLVPPVIVLTGSSDNIADLTAACIVAGAAHVFQKGTAIGLVGSVFETMQHDIVRRASQRSVTPA